MSTQPAAPGRTVRHGTVTAVACIALPAVVAAMSSLNAAWLERSATTLVERLMAGRCRTHPGPGEKAKGLGQ